MFSLISMNWRGRPLVSHETVVHLIASTPSRKGLTIRCELDQGTSEKGLRVSDDERNAVQIERWHCHRKWNYTVFRSAA
jgi:hypothetical protein